MRFTLAIAASLLAAADVAAQDVDYVRDVKPILKERCFACHGALQQKGKLRLDTGEFIRKGGRNGSAAIPQKPTESLLIERITAREETERMPPEGKPLTPEQIAKIKAWIAGGAKSPATEKPESDPREHWAFKKPVRPAAPRIADAAWIKNPIDAFISKQHVKHGLQPLQPADKHVLLRRVYLDLIGLPPTRDALQAFLEDASPLAYEKVVDRLLNSPQYAERWARHWMDVWRYSDWYGRRSVPDVLSSYGMIWRWRDWIVRSVGQDKGYDQMILEMLAADEINPTDDSSLVATGFIVRNFFRWNYNQWKKDLVEHTGKAFLGLTLNCCHCHDHKYDPISQVEYFKFRAFFEPIEIRHDRVPGEPDPGPYPKYNYGSSYGPIKSGMVRIFDADLNAKTLMYSGGDQRNIMAGKPPIEPGTPAILGGTTDIELVTLPAAAWNPALKPFIRDEETRKIEKAIGEAEREVTAARALLDKSRPALEAAVAKAKADVGREPVAKEKPESALAGTQSLFIDATQGRRILANDLPGLKVLPDGATLSFKLWIRRDAHVNFQLARNIPEGLTAAFIAFEKGKIVTYRPDSFTEFEAGRYDVSAKQDRFEVRLELQTSTNQLLLSVKNLADGKMLVSKAPAALNGWNPRQGIFFDARTGSSVAFDELEVTAPGGARLLRVDFEPSAYREGQDVAGRDGWSVHAMSLPGATSKVSAFGAAATSGPRLALQQARAALAAKELAVTAAETKVAAARAQLASFRARIAAESARFSSTNNKVATDNLVREANTKERQAVAAAARGNVAVAEAALAAAEALAASDPKRSTLIQTATSSLTKARAALTQAETALKQPSNAQYAALGMTFPQKSTGRRTALARWIADKDNPLTARVAVNYLWGWHFGRPLVDTTVDFGRNGKRPSHPDLLDWLAVEFMANGWKMKPLHRLIVTSNAYRMRSSLGGMDHPNLAKDPDNRFLWRFNTGRMEAEVVRDSVLHLAGMLDPAIGGPEIPHEQGLTSLRRSIYFAHHGEAKLQFLELFDAANACDAYKRTMSVLPQQALAMSNSELTLKLSRALARKLATAHKQDDDFIRAAFEQVLSRPPSKVEASATRAFLARQEKLFRDSGLKGGSTPADMPSNDLTMRARENLVHALFNHSDFVTIR